ncbi:FCS-Like Zinc finger 8-like [Primulina tabacum]|uniref:FCS-Like Zinc finger 8-like n=1 Tax=Primulina tabacum TaxID=48773 RepID=UPI003F5A7506
MLSNRSRAVASKQALMADQSNSLFSSPTRTPTTPISSSLGSPRFFSGLLTKNLSDAEANVMSPTSILDPKVSSSFVNPFGYDTSLSNPPSKQEQEAIGLALIDSIDEKNDEYGNFSKPLNRMVLFGSKLKVHIPYSNNPSSRSPAESPKSPADFGIKTRNSQCFSPFSGNPEKSFSRQLSLKEMELSEDYTCVITHGSNPKTTHIFDDCIVENCGANDDEITSDPPRETESGFEINVSTFPSPKFLSFCHTCREILEQGQDIYIYRGEKAFCGHECRCQEVITDDMKSPELDDNI